MAYIEVYNDKLMDLVNIGKYIKEFNEQLGDYIKVEIFKPNTNNPFKTLYSNRLMLKYSEADSYYLGEYHYHNEDSMLGFCEGRKHTNNSNSNLKPIPIGNSQDEVLNKESRYKKQIDIFKDSSDRVYIKPNEVLKLLNIESGKYRLRIHFLRNIKSKLGLFLSLNKNNLIENGNFFAGLEATQTGDMDKSFGKNNIIEKENPGFGNFVLEQSGIRDNKYSMELTGVEPNSSYVFSCWVAWGNNYTGGKQLVNFRNVSSNVSNPKNGLPNILNTDLDGSFLNDDSDRILAERTINDLTWYRLYSFVFVQESADLGSIILDLGKSINNDSKFYPSLNPLGARYFTDLRLEKVEGLTGQSIQSYLKNIDMEIK